jgi:DNA-binding protein H-NS
VSGDGPRGPGEAHELDEVRAELRHERDRAAIAREEVAALRDELDAAQRLAAQALDRVAIAQAEAAEARKALAETYTSDGPGATLRPRWAGIRGLRSARRRRGEPPSAAEG